MNYLETILVRSIGSKQTSLVEEMSSLMGKLKEEYPHISIQLYRHATVSSDFCFHLWRHLETGKEDEIGIVLSEALKAFGMISRSIWNPVQDEI